MAEPAFLDRIIPAYHQAWSGAVVLPRPAPDVIMVAGSTRAGFLQRMSTNDFSDVEPGRLRWTVLTTPVARIVDWVQVLSCADELLLLTSPGRGAAVLEWLRRYVLFGDDLTLRLDPEPRQAWLALGPAAGPVAAAVAPGAAGLAPDTWLQSGANLAWRVEHPGAGGWAVLSTPAASSELAERSLPQPLAGALYETLRIEAGIPSPGSEITDERNPLEVGLSPSISLDKGCYIGQEIIARMSSRSRQARCLVGVQLQHRAAPGSQLHQGGASVGWLTSIACSPRLGWIGLGLARPAALQSQPATATIGSSSEPALLVDLPFPRPPA